MHILIADDDPVSREIARHLVARAGHSHELVADGAAALAALNTGAFDAALLDLSMPLLDGAAVARAVSAAPPVGRRPRLVALSAARVEDQLLAHGFDACLTKPLRPQALAAALADDAP